MLSKLLLLIIRDIAIALIMLVIEHFFVSSTRFQLDIIHIVGNSSLLFIHRIFIKRREMIRFKLNKQKKVTSIEYEDVRACNLLCPKCYSEWRYCSGNSHIWVWLHSNICGKTLEDVIKVPCGCHISIWDILSTSIIVDELISRPVSRMNKSGYLTKYSCSGHMYDPHGYINFRHNYDELVNYITGNSYLTNMLRVEVELKGKRKGIMETYEWYPERNSFVKTDFFDYGKEPPLENMTIRMNKPTNMSNLTSMLIFRKCLNKIAKWCEETKVNKDNLFSSKNLDREYLSKGGIS